MNKFLRKQEQSYKDRGGRFRKCYHDIKPGDTWQEGMCRTCWHWVNDPKWQETHPELAENERPKPEKKLELHKCIFHGPTIKDENGRAATRECKECNGMLKTQVLFQCTNENVNAQVTIKDCQACHQKSKYFIQGE